MSEYYSLFLSVAIILWAYMSCWFAISVLLKRNDIADIAWGLGFIVVALSAFLFNDMPKLPAGLVLILTTVWGIRLAVHILTRNRGKKEDYRYAAWRKEWKKLFYIRSYLQVFMLQGLLLFVVALPVIFTSGVVSIINIPLWTIAGLVVWISGFLTETFADIQLRTFMSNKPSPSSVMQTGLWKYSRHPNYFGEILQWWGIWIIMLSTTLPLQLKIIGTLGPLTITTLILFVSGIPMLEKKFMKNPEYKKYAAKTNKIIPGDRKAS